jgi:signal transduction histidine kinase
MVIKEVSQVVKNAKNDIHLIYEIKCFADNALLENMKFDFNEMMSILKQKTDELALYDSNLEKTIKEKTSELETTNSKLQISHNILKEEQIRLNSFSSFLSNLNSVDIQSLAKLTLKQIFDISGSMIGYFIMYEKDELKVIASESIDNYTLNKNEQFIISSPIIKESLLSNKLISINDLPLNSLEPIDIGFAKLNLNNFYSFPLVFQNKPLGVLVLASSKHIDVNYLQGYITALTGSVNNAMNYHYIQEQAIVLEKANIELQKSDKMKSEFLANMSHELRTPLNSIIGFSSILRKNKKGLLEDKQIDQLSKINNNGNHLLGLINNILDLSKIESGKIELDEKDFKLIQFVEDIIGMLNAQAEEKNVKLLFINNIKDKNIMLHTDDVKLRQVCINLIGNALKFVSADTGKVEVVLNSNDKYINICINDNGIGIPKDKLDLIFEPFRQADGSTTRKFGGTGLGLAISRNMIKLLNGTIKVNSKVNKGSNFCIELPSICILKDKEI